MITEEMTAWLGPAADELTEDQADRFARIWDEVDERYPDPDDQDVTAAVLSAAVQYLLGETNLKAAAARLTAARVEQYLALEAGKQIGLLAIEDGMDELAAAKALGVNRTTMRRAAGKQQ